MSLTRDRIETRPPDALPDRRDATSAGRPDQVAPAPPTLATTPTQRSTAQATARRPERFARWAVWFFRSLLLIPFVLMGPEVVSMILGSPDGVAHVSTSTADVLGTSALLIFVMMLAVTPVHTVTGWRWHLVLRRDYGIAMFFVAASDLTLAAIATGNTFPGGVLTRIAGHSFLAAGLISTLLLVPLVVTANRPAQRWLGGYWKTVQRLTYVVWVTVLIHLLFLFGVTSIFLNALAVSVPLAVLRIPAVRRRWRTARRARTHRVLRTVLALALIGVFAIGYVPLVHELAVKGGGAFIQNPPE